MSSARRALQSVTEYKPHKAYPGFTLFSPMTQVPGNTWLIDMQGRFVHRWKLPGWVRLHADLLPNGNILCAHGRRGRAAFISTDSMQKASLKWTGTASGLAI